MRTALGQHWPSLVACLAICFAAAAAGGLATAVSVDGWYRTLDRPAFTPPDWLFAPAWNTLFALMALALWRVWVYADAGRGRRFALGLFGVQLAANVAWSVLFFGLRRPDWALVDVVLLEGLILATIAAFGRLDIPAALLLVPYAAWVAFAVALNGAIWWLT